ncbi:MAG: hypothetical protein NWF14_02575 [Candidatus Bathyarchaeota archaeon]|nr:hypothetical protein [Candidatus Bathyarchaeota archaeon]
MMDNVKISGFVVLFIGVVLLLFTFVSAYQLLIGVLDIASSSDLIGLFGEVLAPLIGYAIRALYLGIMGWIGSILTRRGVQTIISASKEGKAETATKAKEAKEPEKTEGRE